MFANRILSGMRPTGSLHLGHYHGVIKNWVELQSSHDCYFMVADWHALTTNYDDVAIIEKSIWDMVIDWLAAGVDPEKATVFIQSKVPQHAELHLALSMVTPLSWLERVPTYKDQIEKLSTKDLGTYGFLGYPLLQAADILVYKAGLVPVGEDQVPHIELTREVARRFNNLFGREPNFDELAQAAAKKIGKQGKQFMQQRTAYLQDGNAEALQAAREILAASQNLGVADRERLAGWLENKGKTILPEPEAKLTAASRMPGLDGQKMSKSYGNTITMRESPELVSKKVKAMPTDPARVRRTDAGNPEKCPVWQLHQVYSDNDTREWVKKGCTSAGIGCLECKQPVIDGVLREQQPMFERAEQYLTHPDRVKEIVFEGCRRAEKVAKETMGDVRAAMGLGF
ncbi:tryptophan--tRNA ligase [Aquitalea magnusonii]|uniref:tryptophan--tRNA ligase n=1 Tax=Aquitalea TaxID=407217 RepID=UPI0005F76DD4|nr:MULTISPECIES: tryptophan--tRNA ligase [Aquitalea]KJV32714.1 tryptophan--tRNA ligase [Aquitalea magnusonii]QBJ77226.1 tryptophan--tRNA ligase [Aquitalea sp. USM4]